MHQYTLDELMNAQPKTRAVDWSTSAAAAASVNASAGRLLALGTLAQKPDGLTDFELADATGWQQTSIGKRRGELFQAGLVEVATGPDGKPLKRPAPSGKLALVWRLTLAGLEYWKAHSA